MIMHLRRSGLKSWRRQVSTYIKGVFSIIIKGRRWRGVQVVERDSWLDICFLSERASDVLK